MRCPFCLFEDSRVIDSRPAENGVTIRRRRECLSCGKRFTTYEIMERMPLVVIKKNGSRETFDRTKLINGMLRACEKRPVPIADIQTAAEEIELDFQNHAEHEITTEVVGECVMAKLKEMDDIAYVRFASVYRQFKDLRQFVDELNKLIEDKNLDE
ncbi:MAG: transcriptional repressor NrdR [Oscillospiraceae bacterium]|nr:transcriptional repressor NrdR [Oscillospiraceae bacterium]